MVHSHSIRRRKSKDFIGRKLEDVNTTLADMLYRRVAEDGTGKTIPLCAEVSRTEIFALHDLILSLPRCAAILEIGCAMGVSSLVLSAALQGREDGGHHTILDPLQKSYWNDAGRRSLERGGFQNVTVLDEGSELALPRMLQEGREFDFVFQDGMHTFDHALLEFHYLDRILKPGGVLVYDDIDIWGMNRFVRYISLYPHWEIIECIDRPAHSGRRRALQALQRIMGLPFRFLPRAVALEFCSDALIRPDAALGLDASMIVLRKSGPDQRPWDWNMKF